MLLDIMYENSDVRVLFEDLNDVRNTKNLMTKEIGSELTRSVKKRYNQISAFSTFYALQQSGIGKIESLDADLKGSYSLRLTKNYRLIIKPRSDNTSAESLKICDTVIIEGVIDYHGKSTKNNWIIP